MLKRIFTQQADLKMICHLKLSNMLQKVPFIVSIFKQEPCPLLANSTIIPAVLCIKNGLLHRIPASNATTLLPGARVCDSQLSVSQMQSHLGRE